MTIGDVTVSIAILFLLERILLFWLQSANRLTLHSRFAGRLALTSVRQIYAKKITPVLQATLAEAEYAYFSAAFSPQNILVSILRL